MAKQSKHNCKKCGKLCHVFNDDHPGYCTECGKELLLQQQLETVIPKLYRSARIKHLSTQLQDVIQHLNGDGLFLWGVPGSGKTYAMAALERKFIYQGFNVERISWAALSLKIRDTFKQPTVRHKSDSGGYKYDYGEDEDVLSEQDVIEPLLQADKLFIEDIGTGKSEGSYESDFAIRTLERILDERLENCLPTFITTNKSVEEIAISFDDRIASRIVGGCKIVKLSGEDRRKNQKK